MLYEVITRSLSADDAISDSSSPSSSLIFSSTGGILSQSKPTVATRDWIFCARCKAGKATGMSLSTEVGVPEPFSPASSRFARSQSLDWCSGESTLASPNTCGWRLIV